ncbi:MAG: hypothetical protein J2P21_23505 [Chloracidobacterium sp.]|nr:hypothetical protein [Chloracidobacterium sp.]
MIQRRKKIAQTLVGRYKHGKTSRTSYQFGVAAGRCVFQQQQNWRQPNFSAMTFVTARIETRFPFPSPTLDQNIIDTHRFASGLFELVSEGFEPFRLSGEENWSIAT